MIMIFNVICNHNFLEWIAEIVPRFSEAELTQFEKTIFGFCKKTTLYKK